MANDLCIRCAGSPARRAFMYCEPCWRIINGLPELAPPAEPARPDGDAPDERSAARYVTAGGE